MDVVGDVGLESAGCNFKRGDSLAAITPNSGIGHNDVKL